MNQVRISRMVPMEQLVMPEEDVRQDRPEDEVRSIASSMGDPDVGQQQPIALYPGDGADVPDDPDRDDLEEVFKDGIDLVVHDGVTRTLAAEMLGWGTIWGVIMPEPPTNELVARLDANTERVEMSDYETFSALYDHYNSSEATLQDVADKVGLDQSSVSRIFNLFESPDWLHDPWRNDDHPLGTSHAVAVYYMMSDNKVEEYAEGGALTDDEARRKAEEDAKLMIDVQANHDLTVTEFRKRVKRCRKETLDQLRDGRSMGQKQADGQTEKAERQHDHYSTSDAATATCMICGSDADRKFAVDVCEQDYGMLSDMKATDEVLMAQAEQDVPEPEDALDSAGGTVEAAEALAQAAGIDPKQAAEVVEQVQQEAAQAPQEPTND